MAPGPWFATRRPMMCCRFIDARADTGKFVTAILAEPEKFEGRRVCAAASLHTIEEVAAILAKMTGKKIIFKLVSEEEVRVTLPDFAADLFIDAFNYGNEYGYFGSGTVELVAEGAKLARGRLVTFEEYQEKHPLQLVDTLTGIWRPGAE
jgi:hypothetical protein